jgi:uncharacterized protein
VARNRYIQMLPDYIVIVDWLRRAALVAVAALGVMWGSAASSQTQLNSRVVDTTGTLTTEQQSALTRKLAEFEAARGPQIVVIMIGTTQPEPIEEYANRMSNLWKIGRHDVGDGVLLLVAKDDRKLRIEVSRALEGAVPDLAAKRVIDKMITPRFKQGAFAEGIGSGVDRLIELIESEGLPPPLIPKDTLPYLFAGGVILFVMLLVWLGIWLDLRSGLNNGFSASKGSVSTDSSGSSSGWSGSSGSSSDGSGFRSGGGGSFGGGGASGSW